MSALDKISNFLGGSIFREIKDLAITYLPPSMSEEQKLKAEMALDKALHDKQMQAMQMANDATQEFNSRIKEMEGTASDLKQVPIIGPLLLLVRGFQRPLWSMGCMYFDWLWFSGEKAFTEQQSSTLFAINVIVLMFLFGERAVKNALPIVNTFIKNFIKK